MPVCQTPSSGAESARARRRTSPGWLALLTLVGLALTGGLALTALFSHVM